ncbi:MAG TPA: succinylglutamate desuccinylase/aspartoacylase family protein [Acidobacteriota bacterium]|nr:succinylglutamate desuccinylase/aspartoacylase family protein [Acidobacteriota bacterium]
MGKAAELVIGDKKVKAGERVTVDLPVARLYTHTSMSMPVHVVRSKREGPTLFVSAAVHGDEINGTEIIRRLLESKILKRLRGTLLAIPVVNVFGFVYGSRYLPDRRDLNRVFPGASKGSLASQLAHLFMSEIVAHADYGIDLHTGSYHRFNLPQIRCDMGDERTAELARAFGVPVILDATLRDGSLRQAVTEEHKIPMLLYEAGEAMRFDETSIRAGLRGVTNVMRTIGMLPKKRSRKTVATENALQPIVAASSSWVRAPISGILTRPVDLGARVTKGDLLATVTDPYCDTCGEVRSEHEGIIIGRHELPLIHKGDALFHIGLPEKSVTTDISLEAFEEQLKPMAAEPQSFPPRRRETSK